MSAFSFALEHLTNRSVIVSKLMGAGISERGARKKSRLFSSAAAALRERRPSSTACVAHFVPGRVELLGKHTDYAGGRSLIAAVEYGMAAVAIPSPSPELQLVDAARNTSLQLRPGTAKPEGWAIYPWSVLNRLTRDLGHIKGAEIAICSDLPRAAGLSSSSVLITALCLSLMGLQPELVKQAQLSLADPLRLADFLAAIESGRSFASSPGADGVGTRGGSQDHTAILLSRPGRLVQYRFQPVEFERELVLPPGHTLAIAVSGVPSSKATHKRVAYNRNVALVEQIEELWQSGRHIARASLEEILASAAPGEVESVIRNAGLEPVVSQTLLDRLEHFCLESRELIPSVPEKLQAKNGLQTLGKIVNRSQREGARLLGNQTPETVFLADQASRLGAVAASAFGAGFGGSVWAMVLEKRSRSFLRDWAAVYRARFPEPARNSAFFSSPPGPAAFRLSG